MSDFAPQLTNVANLISPVCFRRAYTNKVYFYELLGRGMAWPKTPNKVG